MQVGAKGRSAHAASNRLDDIAIYKMLPVIAGVRDLDAQLKEDPFLGKGTITVSSITCRTPSINAVPDECTITIDRRVTFGETKEEAIAQVQALLPSDDPSIHVEMLFYDSPSYTGFVFPVDKYFPAWALEESHPLVQAGQATWQRLGGGPPPTGQWNFSTKGQDWMGKAGIPRIGVGPGGGVYAHPVLEEVGERTVLGRVRRDAVVGATAGYAVLPGTLKEGFAS